MCKGVCVTRALAWSWPVPCCSLASNATASSNCNLCPVGRFGNTTGLAVSTCSGACFAGYVCPSGSVNGTTVACAAGNYGPDGVGCFPCPVGTYGAGAALPLPTCSGNCSAGYYGNVTGLMTPTCAGPCPAGFACPSGSVTPQACPAGTYSGNTSTVRGSTGWAHWRCRRGVLSCRVPTPAQVGNRATSAVVLFPPRGKLVLTGQPVLSCCIPTPPGCGCCETLMSGVLSMRRRLFRQRQSAHISGVRGAMPSRDVLPPWLDDSDRVSSRLVPSIAHTHFVALNSALHMLRARLGAALPCRLMSPLPTYRLYALTGAQGVGATRLESRRFVRRRVMPATTVLQVPRHRRHIPVGMQPCMCWMVTMIVTLCVWPLCIH